jgi:hypothetical protein
MPIKPEEALELVNFLNLNEVENLEEAKEKFQENWVNSKELSEKLGKINGTIAHVESPRRNRDCCPAVGTGTNP